MERSDGSGAEQRYTGERRLSRWRIAYMRLGA